MRYELKRNKNGMITQCENNADGNNIYAQRQELNKIALKNLKENTPKGKLGDLSNIQVFNFQVSSLSTVSDKTLYREYNTTATGDTACDDAIMFTNGKSGDGLYYNVLDIKANLGLGNVNFNLLRDSFVQFYLLQNSASPIGKKIPRTQSLFSSSAGTITWTTTGAEQGNQYINTDINSDSVNVPQERGIRASGLALKTIQVNFLDIEDLSNIVIDFQVFVDITSVSRTY